MKGTIAKFLAFILICSGFTAYLVVTIGNIRLFSHEYDLTATFDDVTGLLPNDNVKVAGVIVGKVSAIKVEQGRAKVTFSVRDKVKVPTDSTAAIRWRNLLGQRYLYLYPGQSENALESGQAVAKTRPVVDLGALFDELGPIVGAIDPTQVNQVLDTLTQALSGREDKVSEALDDLATLASGLGARDEAIQRLVTNLDTVAATLNRRDAQIEVMLENLVTLAQAFGDNTETLDAALSELGSFGTSLNEVLTSSSDELDRLLLNLSQVTETVRGKLPELDEFLAGFAEASAGVFRAGNRGEFLNQKIICVFLGPPTSNEAGCPTGDPLVGLPISGSGAISSLLTKVTGA